MMCIEEDGERSLKNRSQPRMLYDIVLYFKSASLVSPKKSFVQLWKTNNTLRCVEVDGHSVHSQNEAWIIEGEGAAHIWGGDDWRRVAVC